MVYRLVKYNRAVQRDQESLLASGAEASYELSLDMKVYEGKIPPPTDKGMNER
jgi:hypothetical protein